MLPLYGAVLQVTVGRVQGEESQKGTKGEDCYASAFSVIAA